MNEQVCENCNTTFPEELVSNYTLPPDKNAGPLEPKRIIRACPICISKLSGKRLGIKGDYEFDGDPEMQRKLAHAKGLVAAAAKGKTSTEDEGEVVTDTEEETPDEETPDTEEETEDMVDRSPATRGGRGRRGKNK